MPVMPFMGQPDDDIHVRLADVWRRKYVGLPRARRRGPTAPPGETPHAAMTSAGRGLLLVDLLAAMGLTVSDAVRLLLTKVAQEKALPFAPLVPNAVTIEAMKEARRGGLPRFGSVQDLLDELHADD